MIIRGGENIYPAEIEQFLFKHPKIQEVQVRCWTTRWEQRTQTPPTLLIISVDDNFPGDWCER